MKDVPKMRKRTVSSLVEFREAWVFNFSIWLSQGLTAIAYCAAILSLQLFRLVPEIPEASDAFESVSRSFIEMSEAIRVPAIVRCMRSLYEDIPVSGDGSEL